jgi:NADH:ubiquinone oxidoreductase subunit K
MSNVTRLFLSAMVLLLAAILVLWGGSPLNADMRGYVVVLALFMVAVMWAFPRVGI